MRLETTHRNAPLQPVGDAFGSVVRPLPEVPRPAAHGAHAEGAPDIVDDSIGTGFLLRDGARGDPRPSVGSGEQPAPPPARHAPARGRRSFVQQLRANADASGLRESGRGCENAFHSRPSETLAPPTGEVVRVTNRVALFGGGEPLSAAGGGGSAGCSWRVQEAPNADSSRAFERHSDTSGLRKMLRSTFSTSRCATLRLSARRRALSVNALAKGAGAARGRNAVQPACPCLRRLASLIWHR